MIHKKAKLSVRSMAASCASALGFLISTAVLAPSQASDYTPATISIYQKGGATYVDTFPSVKSITFSGGAGVITKMANAVVHRMQVSPAKGGMFFTLHGTPHTTGSLKVFRINGRLIYERALILNPEGTAGFAGPAMAAGIYIVRFTNGSLTIQNVIPHA